ARDQWRLRNHGRTGRRVIDNRLQHRSHLTGRQVTSSFHYLAAVTVEHAVRRSSNTKRPSLLAWAKTESDHGCQEIPFSSLNALVKGRRAKASRIKRPRLIRLFPAASLRSHAGATRPRERHLTDDALNDRIDGHQSGAES